MESSEVNGTFLFPGLDWICGRRERNFFYFNHKLLKLGENKRFTITKKYFFPFIIEFKAF